jgi:GMP synthase-like glutamine amidotransferase
MAASTSLILRPSTFTTPLVNRGGGFIDVHPPAVDVHPPEVAYDSPTVPARDLALYIDIEHARLRAREEPFQRGYAARIEHFVPRGVELEYVWYGDLTPQKLASERLAAVFVSGNNAEWAEYDASTPSLEPLKRFLASDATTTPTLALCGGHQLVAMAFGAHVDHMEDTTGEVGAACEVDIEDPDDPLFGPFGATAKFMQSHHDEVTEVHPAFVLLASSPACAIQALRHRTRPLYTVQFHPEQDARATVPNGDGSRLLERFFTLVR